MKATLSFERKIGDATESLGELTFLPGDYYNIYNHMVVDSGLGSDEGFIAQFCGLQVTTIEETKVSIKKLLPPDLDAEIGEGASVELDFARYGTYRVSLVTIEA